MGGRKRLPVWLPLCCCSCLDHRAALRLSWETAGRWAAPCSPTRVTGVQEPSVGKEEEWNKENSTFPYIGKNQSCQRARENPALALSMPSPWGDVNLTEHIRLPAARSAARVLALAGRGSSGISPGEQIHGVKGARGLSNWTPRQSPRPQPCAVSTKGTLEC